MADLHDDDPLVRFDRGSIALSLVVLAFCAVVAVVELTVICAAQVNQVEQCK